MFTYLPSTVACIVGNEGNLGWIWIVLKSIVNSFGMSSGDDSAAYFFAVLIGVMDQLHASNILKLIRFYETIVEQQGEFSCLSFPIHHVTFL